MRVAIIGGGPAGLVFLKEALAANLDATVFEAQPETGGVFAQRYDGARLTASSVIMPFSDFQDEQGPPRFWTFEEYHAYLERYIGHFGLRLHIRVGNQVVSIRRDDDRWQLRIRETSSGLETSRMFDRVAICTGTHTHPYRPSFNGENSFGGRIMHSSEFRSAADFAGKRVLLIGAGESGSDIALEVARAASQSAISIRRQLGHLAPRSLKEVSPRFKGADVSDLDTTRAHHSLPSWFGPKIAWVKQSLGRALFGSREPVLALMAEINLAQRSSSMTRFGTKNVSVIKAMVEHGCQRKPAVLELAPREVVFADGTRFGCDVIICCTGYSPRFSFLGGEFSQVAQDAGRPRQNLYKHMFHPQVGPHLAFGGFVRPAFGGIPPMAELQARFFAQLCTGDRTLPEPARMQASIAADDARVRAQYSDDAERIGGLTDYLVYMDDVARLIGCLPSPSMIRDPALWARVLLGPLNTAQYRLTGPGAQDAIARALITRLPARGSSGIYLALLALCRVLHTLGFENWRPAATWNSPTEIKG